MSTTTITKLGRFKVRLGRWVVANAVGQFATVIVPLPVALLVDFVAGPGQSSVPIDSLAGFAQLALVCATILFPGLVVFATIQWWGFGDTFQSLSMRRWVATTIIGFLLAGVVALGWSLVDRLVQAWLWSSIPANVRTPWFAANYYIQLFLSGAITGAAVMIPQAVTLRRCGVQTMWWVPAGALGGGLVACVPLLSLIYFGLALKLSSLGLFIEKALFAIVKGIVLGLMTGLVLRRATVRLQTDARATQSSLPQAQKSQ